MIAAADATRLRRVRLGTITQIRPHESLVGVDTLDELGELLAQCIDDGDTKIVIEMGAVQIISSKGLELLTETQDQLLRHGGWLRVSKLNPVVADVLRITAVSDHIGTVDAPGDTTPPVVTSGRLGDILVERGLLTATQLADAIKQQKRLGKKLGEIIISKGWASEHDVLNALGQQLSIPYVKLRPGVLDPEITDTIDAAIARRLEVLPLFCVRGDLFLAMANPQAIPSLEEIEDRTGMRVRPVLARAQDILTFVGDQGSLSEYAAELSTEVGDDFEVVDGVTPDDYSAIDEIAGASPVINLVNSIVQRAVRDGASDIHIEPFRKHARIRFRIDGLLYELSAPRIELHPAIVSRLKVMSNLDIAERRLPQDGRIQVMTQGRSVDLRFSSLPGLFGEKVVLRVLDKNQAILDVDKLGMAQDNVDTFKRLLGCQHGLILVTGPTGSGKTTSLYAALNFLKSIEKNIVTIEDPVEYQLDIINQNEVRPRIGLTFAKILKHVLRQDPDIIMVGEIRERETAEIAVQAALTGHLVLSTLHTNDSPGAITRMIDMGVEPYLLSSAVIGVVAQRLVRHICPACTTTSLAPPELLQRYGWQDETVHLARGRGCVECYDSGFKGRLAIHEMLETDEALQRLIVSEPSRDELSDYLKRQGVKNMFHDGLHRVREHKTTIEELARVTSL